MARKHEFKSLTHAEMQVMNILWDNGKGMTTREIIARYPEPLPAYSTIATFMKILTNKKFVGTHKQEGRGKAFIYYPLVTRAEYTKRTMKEVKDSFFGGSFHALLSFFIKEENISEEELEEILLLIRH